MEEKDLEKIKSDIANLEEYTPILNERIASNELALQKLEVRF